MVPAIAPILGKAAAWVGGTAAAKKALPTVKKWGGSLMRKVNGSAAAGGSAGLLGGWSLSNIADDLGIDADSRTLKIVVVLALLIGAVMAVGQLFDIQLGGD